MARGLRRKLTRYGDEAFSLFLRKAFIKAAGYSDDALDRPLLRLDHGHFRRRRGRRTGRCRLAVTAQRREQHHNGRQ